jgi:hypothetical protein
MKRALAVCLLSLLCGATKAAVNVGVVLDTQRAASVVIGENGGTVTATAADGTIFTLTILEKALLNSETITMTPVAQTTNLPFAAGMIAAVQLEPRGLRLFKMATLSIMTPTPIPLGAETPMGWHRDGSDMYLQPLFRDPKSITFKLIHFSGVGVANGTNAERQAQLARIPCDLEAAINQRLMPIVQADRVRQLTGLPPEGDVNGQIVEVLMDYFNFSIRPMMAVALQSKDDDILYSAVLRAMATTRTLSLWLNDTDPFFVSATAELANFITQALQIWSDSAFDRCIRDHKVEELRTLLLTERIVQMLGISVDLRTNQKLEQCGSLELVFESTIVQTKADIRENMYATATVPIRIKFEIIEPGPVVATGPLHYNYQFVFPVPEKCSLSVSNTNDTFAILDMKFNLNPKQPEDVCKSRRRAAPHAISAEEEPAKPVIELVSMTIDPGHPTEMASLTCPGGTTPLGLKDQFQTNFEGFHLKEERGTQRYKIENWVPGTGDLLLQKSYNQDMSMLGVTWTEVTTLKLFHRPPL